MVSPLAGFSYSESFFELDSSVDDSSCDSSDSFLFNVRSRDEWTDWYNEWK